MNDINAECRSIIRRIFCQCAERQEHKARKLPKHLWLEVSAIARRLNQGNKP